MGTNGEHSPHVVLQVGLMSLTRMSEARDCSLETHADADHLKSVVSEACRV